MTVVDVFTEMLTLRYILPWLMGCMENARCRRIAAVHIVTSLSRCGGCMVMQRVYLRFNDFPAGPLTLFGVLFVSKSTKSLFFSFCVVGGGRRARRARCRVLEKRFSVCLGSVIRLDFYGCCLPPNVRCFIDGHCNRFLCIR